MDRETLVYIGDVLLPVPPEKITYKAQNQNKTFKLINGEEINQVLPPGLSEITMEKILLPNEAYHYCLDNGSGEVYSAAFLLKLFETLKREKRTFSLIINNSSDGLCNDGHNEDGLYTLESYTAYRSIDLNHDFEATLVFKEYVDYGVQTVALASVAKAAASSIGNLLGTMTKTVKQKKKRATTKNNTTEQTYTVKQGDTLWAIAKSFYGDGSLYPYLADLNGLKNANVINVGQVLRIGPKEDAEKYKGKTSSGTSGSSKNSSTGTSTSSTISSNNTANTTSSTKVLVSGYATVKSVVPYSNDTYSYSIPTSELAGVSTEYVIKQSESAELYKDYTVSDLYSDYKKNKTLENLKNSYDYQQIDKKSTGIDLNKFVNNVPGKNVTTNIDIGLPIGP